MPRIYFTNKDVNNFDELLKKNKIETAFLKAYSEKNIFLNVNDNLKIQYSNDTNLEFLKNELVKNIYLELN